MAAQEKHKNKPSFSSNGLYDKSIFLIDKAIIILCPAYASSRKLGLLFKTFLKIKSDQCVLYHLQLLTVTRRKCAVRMLNVYLTTFPEVTSASAQRGFPVMGLTASGPRSVSFLDVS